jgi:hypothetical protein
MILCSLGMAGVAVLSLLAAGCADGDDGPAGGAAGGTEPPGITTSASIPDDIDTRLARRITEPLPDDVVVRVQRINRGPDPRSNVWWQLTADGDVRLARHSRDTSDPDTPFDAPLPDAPTMSLGADAATELVDAIVAAGFAAQPAYQANEGVEDGTFLVVTARLPDGRVHEVAYVGVERPPVDAVLALTERIVEGS